MSSQSPRFVHTKLRRVDIEHYPPGKRNRIYEPRSVPRGGELREQLRFIGFEIYPCQETRFFNYVFIIVDIRVHTADHCMITKKCSPNPQSLSETQLRDADI